MENFDFDKIFNNFNFEQLKEIYMGYKAGFDYSIYSKSEYNANQMRQIRYGLISILNV